MTGPEWYFTIFGTASILMMSFLFGVGVIVEFLKCVGIIPNPKRINPNHDGHGHTDNENSELLVLVMPSEDN